MDNLLEVWPDSEDFMDKILHADDAELAEIFLNDVVAGYGCSVASNLKFFIVLKMLRISKEVDIFLTFQSLTGDVNLMCLKLMLQEILEAGVTAILLIQKYVFMDLSLWSR